MLAGSGVGDGFLGRGQLRGKLGAVAAVGLPGDLDGKGQEERDQNLCEL